MTCRGPAPAFDAALVLPAPKRGVDPGGRNCILITSKKLTVEEVQQLFHSKSLN